VSETKPFQKNKIRECGQVIFKATNGGEAGL
jgi:hypothetical protein